MSLSARLYFHVELRAKTLRRSGSSRPSWVIISSVSPSLRYSWSASPERLSKGRTARVNLAPDCVVGLRCGTTQYATTAAAQNTTAIARMRSRRRAELDGPAARDGGIDATAASAECAACTVGSGAT